MPDNQPLPSAGIPGHDGQMENWLKRLKIGLGPLGFIADLLTVALANWGVIVAAVIAFGATFTRSVYSFIGDPHVKTFGAVFLWALWTYIALSILYRLHRGIKTIPNVDYAFGIIIEGVSLHQDQTKDGNIQPNVQFRNVVNGAIKAHVTDVRVVVNGRTHPDASAITMVVPRLAQKGISAGLFKKSDLPQKGKIEGNLDMTIEYGPHDGDAVRKLRIKMKLIIQPPPVNTGQWGFGNEYISEEDTPI